MLTALVRINFRHAQTAIFRYFADRVRGGTASAPQSCQKHDARKKEYPGKLSREN
jgi:hypothetical protein